MKGPRELDPSGDVIITLRAVEELAIATEAPANENGPAIEEGPNIEKAPAEHEIDQKLKSCRDQLEKLGESNQNAKLSRPGVLREYPLRGALRQFRLIKVTTFTCNRCNREKTSKLVATTDGDWQNLMCNGCYGSVLKEDSQ